MKIDELGEHVLLYRAELIKRGATPVQVGTTMQLLHDKNVAYLENYRLSVLADIKAGAQFFSFGEYLQSKYHNPNSSADAMMEYANTCRMLAESFGLVADRRKKERKGIPEMFLSDNICAVEEQLGYNIPDPDPDDDED